MTQPPWTRPAGVLFDMDGTLFDTEHLHWGSAMAVVEQHRRKDSPAPQLTEWIGWNETDFWNALRRDFDLPHDNATLIQLRDTLFLDMLDQEGPRWMAGAQQLLDDLQAADIPCAVVTAAPRTQLDRVAEIAGFDRWFQTWLSGETDCTRSKPHPEPYREGARRLGCEAPACLAIEDSPTGVQSAVAAGCVTLAVPSLPIAADRFAGATAIMDTLDEVVPWLNQQGAQIQRATRLR